MGGGEGDHAVEAGHGQSGRPLVLPEDAALAVDEDQGRDTPGRGAPSGAGRCRRGSTRGRG